LHVPSAPELPLRRFLPFDHDFRFVGTLGNLLNPDNPPNPPTFEELAEAGVIAPADDPDRFFNKAERATAAWLRSRGLDVLSVNRRTGQRARTPDAVIAGEPVTLETKGAVASENSIVQQIRGGRGQSRRIVVDARSENANLATAQAGLAHALRHYGQQLDEVVIVLTDGSAVGWWYARKPRSV
jgi:hypothetical protein